MSDNYTSRAVSECLESIMAVSAIEAKEAHGIAEKYRAMEKALTRICKLPTYRNPISRQGEGWNNAVESAKAIAEPAISFDPLL